MKNIQNKTNGGRSSNIELLRIVMMFAIIAHHLVVNSGVGQNFTIPNPTLKMIFLQFIGCGGKIGINVFLLITGYFMCNSQATLYKWSRLFIEYCFYSLVINTLFLAFGYMPVGKISLIQGYVPALLRIGTYTDFYPALFMLLYLMIPFINKLIKAMSKKEYMSLIAILVFVFSIISTFLWRRSTTDGHWFIVDNWEGLGWYITVYLIGGYIRKYLPSKIDTLKVGVITLVAGIVVMCGSILLVDYSGVQVSPYFMVAGANKFLAIVIAVALFITFKNISMPRIKTINVIASSTFGVLLIHANSDTMRHWLWKDTINVNAMYVTGGTMLILKVLVSVLLIYAVCSCIALAVNKWILIPIFNRIKNIEFFTKALY